MRWRKQNMHNTSVALYYTLLWFIHFEWFNCFLFLWLFAVLLMVCVTKVAKAALEKALAENEDIDSIVPIPIPQLPIVSNPSLDLQQPLVVKVADAQDNQEKWNTCPVNSSPQPPSSSKKTPCLILFYFFICIFFDI